jgi:hypothetical protein
MEKEAHALALQNAGSKSGLGGQNSENGELNDRAASKTETS